MTDSRHKVSAAWAADRPPRRQQPLSREQIVRGAVDYLEQHGLEELSMRKLAAHLGTAATSMYWHVATKDQLLDLVLDEIFGEVRLPGEDGEPLEELRGVLCEVRRVLSRYPEAARLAASRPTLGPRALRVVEYTLGALLRAGYPEESIAYAYNLLANYTIGGVLVELSRQRVAASRGASDDTSEEADTMRAFVASLPGEDFPHFIRLSGLLVKTNDEDSFAFGLDRLLAGIRSDLTA
ncbi:TetR/AcrR family transcriptional regulator C-terminal domain-containing protein [Streptomyces sioyaensis]|uniref:TetR/AcrR family transcriptional regulator C-terminal domain-containing protein n=1 Tax=Streptomyces sioyaensis TaxID=67364 RepID=UPI001F295557|nr:TetR/AcrR family transcriptional regulator C-terminal domain-containing protein [Streptomyces sioyaensis]MCF3176763.1 TetR/AcrR family transcriptional regulator C-terminal domain-containing protein [Streptomyces sioyaensis]